MIEYNTESYAPEYGPRRLSNHVPMALFALDNLGATDKEQASFLQEYASSLDKVDNKTKISIDDNNFSKYLGKRQAYLGYYRFFIEKIYHNKHLRYLPLLEKGISAGAFHALIRTAYGIEAKNEREIAAGLAYWADAYLALHNEGEGGNRSINDDDSNGIINLRGEAGLEYRSIGERTLEKYSLDEDLPSKLSGVIFEKMFQVSRENEISGIFKHIYSLDSYSLQDIAESNLNVYLRTANFTALHGVTGAHALRILLPLLEKKDRPLFVKSFAVSSIAAMLTIPKDSFEQPYVDQKEVSDSGLLKKCLKSKDDHDIKLFYTCIEEGRFYQNKLYSAASKLRLLGR